MTMDSGSAAQVRLRHFGLNDLW